MASLKSVLYITVTILYLILFSKTIAENNATSVLRSNDTPTSNFNLSSKNEDFTEDKITSADMATTANPVAQAKAFEKGLKNGIKMVIKQILPILMKYNSNSDSGLSRKCVRSLTKYIGSLTAAKVWAIRMFDATSKPPAGIFEATFSDFGAFDQCLEIIVPTRTGMEEFRGSYCAIEAKPYMLPIPRNFSLAHRASAGPLDQISVELLKGGSSLFYFHFQFGVCVPSTCTASDIQSIANTVGLLLKMHVKIPKCYVQEEVRLEVIHIVVIFVLVALIFLAIVGTALDVRKKTKDEPNKSFATMRSVLLSFSVIHNYEKLISSNGSKDMRALHGIRALSIAWVILGHVYVWPNFKLLRRPKNIQNYFNHFTMGAILNAWLSVESFFFLSGLLTCYGCIQWMEKTKGRIHIPFYILRRYIRLTPSFLLVMGLIFFLPLISSGPFWYEKIDPEIEACRTNWWTNLLYINNWFPINQICIHPTWYLAADFQLYIFALLILYPLYRLALYGYLTIGLVLVSSFLTIGILTYLRDLSPFILISSGNEKLILDTVEIIHIKTFTHVGPYCIGMLTGYFILKYKDIKLSKLVCCLGWCLSFCTSVSSLYGVYQWNIGYSPGPLLTYIYAAVHRTTFTIGVAWVAYACVTGRAGLVNTFLSSSVFVPLSRLTYTTYLIQSLVIWTRRASERERYYFSHYNQLYEWIANWFVSVLLALPLYLLVEAPVANLDRLLFSGAANKETESTEPGKRDKDLFPHITHSVQNSNGTVELKSIQAAHPDILSVNSIANGHFSK